MVKETVLATFHVAVGIVPPAVVKLWLYVLPLFISNAAVAPLMVPALFKVPVTVVMLLALVLDV